MGRTAAKQEADRPEEEKNFNLEEAFLVLEDKIRKLENENVTLEESFLLYQQGMDILKKCNQQIDAVEKKVLKINEAGGLDEF